MAIHQRQVIREAVKAALLLKTAASDRVFETRLVPYKKMELPAVAVYTLEESVEPDSKTTAPRELTRTLKLAVEACVREGDNVDDAMDAITLDVERAMHADETFGGACGRSVLASTDLTVTEIGDQPVGLALLTYTITYYTFAPDAADVALNDFARANIRTNLSGTVNPANEAEDDPVVPIT